jgi:hypothetical protein
MKMFCVLLALLFLAAKIPAQPASGFPSQGNQPGDDSFAPLLVFTNGGGRIDVYYPYHAGMILRVGQTCEALAVPDQGYVFTGWNPINVFTLTGYETDGQGNSIPIASTNYSAVNVYHLNPLLKFTVEPEELLFESMMTNENMIVTNIVLTSDLGWQANFVKSNGRWP